MPPPPPHAVVRNRFLGFLIWQSIPSTLIFLLFKTLSPSSSSASSKPLFPFAPWFFALITFLSFLLSQLLFSAALSLVSSTHPHPLVSPLKLSLDLLRFLLLPAASNLSGSDPGSRVRARVTARFVAFVAAAAAASGVLAAVAVSGEVGGGVWGVGRVGFRGFVMGFLYGLYYVYTRKWVLEFPIIQRPPFFSFKMGIPAAVTQSLKLSIVAYLVSAVLVMFLPHEFHNKVTVRRRMAEQITFYIGSFLVFLCWELSHHLHQVLNTKRCIFAPPKGSAAAETNPTEHLLAALEESTPNSLPQYLAYLDLCMICENNVDTWRRAAFYEESGETYKRVVSVCLRPLEQLASILGEGLESNVNGKSQISNQLLSPTDQRLDSKYSEPFNSFQLYAWCAWSAASLTARSNTDDRSGVAQRTGSNAAVVSTLISCLLAVETYMGKKTSVPAQFMGPASIKWATSSVGNVGMAKKRVGPIHPKAYALADVLKNSIYHIVSACHDQMVSSAKTGVLEKYWVIKDKPPFGSPELLVQKLSLFLDFRAS
ncbi:uncharacterized protein LOC126787666 [Argentina anserina]|uniref:uncharacterized protein LOC126787666 n=1 Tax=Argentina anserina TaxID=57926 RepID=UPI00217645EF|nr:uncharacterized protein LOC126787666 [Potentilla anserina]